jgi:hypothetical protein
VAGFELPSGRFWFYEGDDLTLSVMFNYAAVRPRKFVRRLLSAVIQMPRWEEHIEDCVRHIGRLPWWEGRQKLPELVNNHFGPASVAASSGSIISKIP